MKIFISWTGLVCLLFILQAEADNHFIKVSPTTDAKCVTYYRYQGELYCSTTAEKNTQLLDPHLKEYERLNIKFDDRAWQLAWGKVEKDGTTSLEYIPKGGNIENWHELITSQFFPDLQQKVTPKQFAELFHQQYLTAGYKPIVTFLEDIPNQVIVEFRFNQTKNQTYDEMQMLTQDTKGLYMLHYVVKKADMGKKEREKWLANLQNSKIKP